MEFPRVFWSKLRISSRKFTCISLCLVVFLLLTVAWFSHGVYYSSDPDLSVKRAERAWFWNLPESTETLTQTPKITTMGTHSTSTEKGEYLSYKAQPRSDEYTLAMLDEDFPRCVQEPNKQYCLLIANEKLQMLKKDREDTQETVDTSTRLSTNSVSEITSSETTTNSEPLGKRRHHPIHATVLDFSRLLQSHYIDSTLIEPSILFCMMKPYQKLLLVKRGFNMTSLLGSENVVTFGVQGVNVTKLDDKDVNLEFESVGFHHWSTRRNVEDWYKTVSGKKEEFMTTHHFYIRGQIVVHVVVFHNRGNYLWHSKLSSVPQEVLQVIKHDEFLFVGADSAYERFYPVFVKYSDADPVGLYIPSSPNHFLHQIASSLFLECNLTRSLYLNITTDVKDGPYYSPTEYKGRFLIALQELKTQLHPQLMNFFIFAGTMLGWYRQCDIIPYTTDLDFGAYASDIDDGDSLISKFEKNPYLSLKVIMGLPEEAFEFALWTNGVKADLFFLYRDGNNYWASGHRPSKGYYFRYTYPKFTLCSADLFGHKVQVPCETESVIIAEYGPGWQKPVSQWNYEYSPKNMGPRKFWSEEQKKKLHKIP